jgi:hypothetical protein
MNAHEMESKTYAELIRALAVKLLKEIGPEYKVSVGLTTESVTIDVVHCGPPLFSKSAMATWTDILFTHACPLEGMIRHLAEKANEDRMQRNLRSGMLNAKEAQG